MNRLFPLVVLFGCEVQSTMQTKCESNDSSVSTKSCYNAALDEGVVDGRESGNEEGYAQGWRECEAAHAADTADSGDTGNSADSGDSAG